MQDSRTVQEDDIELTRLLVVYRDDAGREVEANMPALQERLRRRLHAEIDRKLSLPLTAVDRSPTQEDTTAVAQSCGELSPLNAGRLTSIRSLSIEGQNGEADEVRSVSGKLSIQGAIRSVKSHGIIVVGTVDHGKSTHVSGLLDALKWAPPRQGSLVSYNHAKSAADKSGDPIHELFVLKLVDMQPTADVPKNPIVPIEGLDFQGGEWSRLPTVAEYGLCDAIIVMVPTDASMVVIEDLRRYPAEMLQRSIFVTDIVDVRSDADRDQQCYSLRARLVQQLGVRDPYVLPIVPAGGVAHADRSLRDGHDAKVTLCRTLRIEKRLRQIETTVALFTKMQFQLQRSRAAQQPLWLENLECGRAAELSGRFEAATPGSRSPSALVEDMLRDIAARLTELRAGRARLRSLRPQRLVVPASDAQA